MGCSIRLWFIVAQVDAGGVSNVEDSIIAYDQWAALGVGSIPGE